MNCPNCRSSLTLAERQGIEIDFCPTCRGVWLDRGELDKIIERSAVNEIRPLQEERRYHGEGLDDRRREKPHRRRKEGFLGELFDF